MSCQRFFAPRRIISEFETRSSSARTRNPRTCCGGGAAEEAKIRPYGRLGLFHETMLTRQIDQQSASSGAAGADADADVSANIEAVESNDEEGWAVVSLPDGEDGANNLAGLDLESINQASASGVSSLSSTNGGHTFDGQTILGSLGPGDDDDDDDEEDDDGMLLLDISGPGTTAPAIVEREDNDNLSIPDSVPSNIRSIRSIRSSTNRGADPNAVGARERRQKRQYDIVLIAFLALLSFGATFLASTWRRSALRLEAELDTLRSGADGDDMHTSINNRSRESTTISSPAPPLFRGNKRHKEEFFYTENEATPPFTVADNCYIKATASVSLGTCGNEIKENIQNASATVLDSLSTFATQFGSIWKQPPHRPDRNRTSSPKNVFEKLNKFWKDERNRWNKASERFASEFASAASYGTRNASSSAKLLANRTAATAQHTADAVSVSAVKIADEVGSLVSSILSSNAGSAIVDTISHTNEAIDHSISNLFEHARDAIEESTSIVRIVSANSGVDGEVKSERVQTKGLLQYLNLTTYKLPRFGRVKREHGEEIAATRGSEQSKGLLQYVPSMFLNLSTFKLVAHELPVFSELK